VDSKVDRERDRDNLAGKSRWRWHLLQKRWPHWARRLTPRDVGAVTSLIWEHIINPFARFGLDMGGKPGSISVQMAPGDTTVGSRPNSHYCARDESPPQRFHSKASLSASAVCRVCS
jgi:hypothetical protein